MNSLWLEHVSEELLERYLARQGSESEVEVVETHLLVCDSCRDRLDELEDYRTVMRQGFALLASQPEQVQARARLSGLPAWRLPRWSPRFSMIAAAAALALAAFLLVPANVSLTSERGSDTAATAPPGRILQLHLDSSGLPDGEVSVEIVDSNGNAIGERQLLVRSNQVTVGVRPLWSGLYYARIYSSKDGHLDSDRLLREFGFQVR